MARHFPPALLLFLLAAPISAAADGPNDADAQAAAAANEPSAKTAKKYDLTYKFTPGETVRTEVVHRAAVQTTIQGTTQKADTNSHSIKVWRIDSVDEDGTATFTHMVEHIDMWQRTTGRNEVRYNSDEPGQVPSGYEEVAGSVGMPLSVVTMNTRGKILKRKEARDQPMAMSTQMTMPLPEGPIAVGESWTSPSEISVAQKDGTPKKIQTRQKFTLQSVDDDVATIQVDCQVLTPVHDPAIEAQLIQRLSSGSVRFDMTAGRVLSQLLELDKHVIGFSGPASSMHYVTRFTEKLLGDSDAAAETARRAAAKAK